MRAPLLALALSLPFAFSACEALDQVAEATGTDLSALSADGITEQLTAVADEFLSGQGFELPGDVQTLLDDLIRGGADTLLQNDLTAASLDGAKTNLVTFLEALLEASGADSGQQTLQATADTFAQVKASLCPLAPFC